MSSSFPESRASAQGAAAPGSKCKIRHVPLFLLLPLALVSQLTPRGMEYPFGYSGSAGLAVSPPRTLPTASPLMWGNIETALMLCQPCSAIAKTLECYQHPSGCQCKAQHWEGCCGKMTSSSARPNPNSHCIKHLPHSQFFDHQALSHHFFWRLDLETSVQSLGRNSQRW